MIEDLAMSERVVRLEGGRWEILARAKLNLGLRIFPARPDGFHDLESWFVPISWHDTLQFNSGGALKLEVTGRAEGVPTDLEKNLVGRAAVRLAKAAGVAAEGTITLHKVLPPGGGLGGGSSDAASALVMLNEAWGLRWGEEKLRGIAAELGSDVPFFVRGEASLCTGRGEIMTPLPAYHTLFAVLLLPPRGLGTKEVYQAFDAGHQHKGLGKTDWQRCARSTAEELSGLLVNDLEPPAFAIAPWVAELRERAAKSVRRKVHMTGSGSTLYALCGSGVEAAEIQKRVEADLRGDCACVSARIER